MDIEAGSQGGKKRRRRKKPPDTPREGARAFESRIWRASGGTGDPMHHHHSLARHQVTKQPATTQQSQWEQQMGPSTAPSASAALVPRKHQEQPQRRTDAELGRPSAPACWASVGQVRDALRQVGKPMLAMNQELPPTYHSTPANPRLPRPDLPPREGSGAYVAVPPLASLAASHSALPMQDARHMMAARHPRSVQATPQPRATKTTQCQTAHRTPRINGPAGYGTEDPAC